MPFKSKLNEALSKTYDPLGTEKHWQRVWDETRVFHPKPNASGEPFSIVIPPPNVTGSLHMGHAFNTALIDTIIRFHRLQGKNVLCLPGTDHASIAVQTILEKQLKDQGTTLDEVGREAFLKMAWDWKAKSGSRIVDQLRRLGYSVDWKRQRFTLDQGLSAAVSEAFIRLHQQGLIYRGEYLVNWCPASGSAVSDLEVEMKEIDGFLWHFRYPISSNSLLRDSPKYLVVATTRPETMFGDVAVAVNPVDERYRKLIGKKVLLPLVNREIPIIGDEFVDKNFGTGCVKVTPAHDPNDFAIGQRHHLPQITVLNKNGTMNDQAGSFEGLDRFEAREAVLKELKTQGLLIKAEPYRHSVPFSDRGKVPVEPLLSTQWFVRMEPMAARCRAQLLKGEPKFIPDRWTKVYRDWLTDIRDWCISRQLWWGHRIPAWFIISETENKITNKTPYVVASSEEKALILARQQYGAKVEIQQDPDVLDTWFSSGLWPFSVLGWPDENNKDLIRWYPTNTLVTGFDIIFFWVARMTMLAGTFTGKMPFADVYIHGLVRDEQNRKMSKSLGNGIDPLLLIEKYGADALRFALVREVAGAGQDIRLDFDRKTETSATIEASRNFANKLWNATRFALINLGEDNEICQEEIHISRLRLADQWILSRLARVTLEIEEKVEQYSLGEAAKGLYEFAWNDFCDWYLELIKPRLNSDKSKNKFDVEDQKKSRQILFKVLTDFLIIFHPFMPHLTEELWHALTGSKETKLLSVQAWPVVNKQHLNEELEKSFLELFNSIRLVRNLRAVAGLKPSQEARVRFVTSKDYLASLFQTAKDEIQALTKASTLEILNPSEAENKVLEKSLSGFSGELEVVLPLEGLVDLESLRSRLQKDIEIADRQISLLSNRLANPNFAKKAPIDIVNECRSNLEEAKIQEELARKRLKDIS